MLAVSTSWSAGAGMGPAALLEALEDLPVEGLELDYRLDKACFEGLAGRLGRSRLAAVSLHNFCPFPGIVKNRPPGGDYFNLADPDREKRHLAVEWTIKTLEHASDLEAPLVVLHCGKVPEDDFDRRLKQKLTADKQGADPGLKAELEARMEVRRMCAPLCLDALLFSLDRLVRYAERLGITLAIENRYYWNELPAFDELGRILETFRGAPLGYWHDMGHARAQELLGLIKPGAFQATYAENLVGLHVHDARGLLDHLPPGRGELDFKQLVPYLQNGNVPLVIELAPGTALESLRQGIEHLRKCLGLPFELPGDDFPEIFSSISGNLK